MNNTKHTANEALKELPPEGVKFSRDYIGEWASKNIETIRNSLNTAEAKDKRIALLESQLRINLHHFWLKAQLGSVESQMLHDNTEQILLANKGASE